MPWMDSLWQRWKVAAGEATPTGRLYQTLRRSTWDMETRYTRAQLCLDALKHSRYGNPRHIVIQGWFFEDIQGQTERLVLNPKQQIWKCSQSSCICTRYTLQVYIVSLRCNLVTCSSSLQRYFKLRASMMNLHNHWLIKSLHHQVCVLKIGFH